MKKLIPLMLGMALTFGAVSMYGNNGPQKEKTTKAKTTKSKSKSTKKS